ncbi:hemicentin-2-like isoform X2 [Pectinophora gossypiella]|uniref:hemicentin-2-like isoform X2 n=1 Tax=Pectinophora gossypiella TaxID=13191 RepID=UPI00214E56A1|nr:hemicentin-2-like isoform X2 [Pectinophora gossypiella]
MQRAVLLMAVLTPISPLDNFTEPGTMPPAVVFRNPRPYSPRPRKTSMRQGKSDSPMLNYIFDSYATSNKHFHDKFRPPSFEGDVSSEDTSIDADTGATVNFDCQVASLRDKTVSWIKVSDDENLELLTLDLETHTADSRFRVDLASETWRLTLSDARATDSGVYCCHVSTHPPMLKRFKLTIHRPEIKLTKEAFLETSETLSLKCMILHLHPGDSEPALRWYRGNSSVPLDEIRGGVLIETDYLTFTSHLQVAMLKVEDAGNYTCALHVPMEMRTVARVHVLRGSSLAELQSGVKTTTSYLSLLMAAMLVVIGAYSDVR